MARLSRYCIPNSLLLLAKGEIFREPEGSSRQARQFLAKAKEVVAEQIGRSMSKKRDIHVCSMSRIWQQEKKDQSE